MFTFELTLNIFILAGMLAVCLFAGYGLKNRQLSKARFRIIELEKEMLSNYAEILELQKEYISMEMRLRELQIPVIPMKTVVNNDVLENDKFADVTMRKKLLLKDTLKQSSVAIK